MSGADERRQREFATVRDCARTALGQLGIGPVPITSGRGGEPIWPNGIVGSMTHCTGYRGVAVARDHLLAAVGIDAEPHEALPGSGLRHISSQVERAQLAGRRSDGHWDWLIFCAKEATYKRAIRCSEGDWISPTSALTFVRLRAPSRRSC